LASDSIDRPEQCVVIEALEQFDQLWIEVASGNPPHLNERGV
jgi:hypothetical protein